MACPRLTPMPWERTDPRRDYRWTESQQTVLLSGCGDDFGSLCGRLAAKLCKVFLDPPLHKELFVVLDLLLSADCTVSEAALELLLEGRS